ncbi:putative polyketide synthase 16 [Stylophora pistillata]|uniref:Putative polyketide synthase 16 n=1 Tax=Stylophora pistillata TaxID=50429 RepID=A0A2B4R535_STYPI|nr:putative polyketide synthase 16 [Stylophora pistillata]
MEKVDETTVENLCFSLNERRSPFPHRLAVPFSSIAEASQSLSQFADESVGWDKLVSNNGKFVFMFGGQGSQWYAMGRQLIECEATFRDAVSAVNNLLKNLGATWNLMDELMATEGESRISENYIAQPATFAIQYATAKLLMSWKIHPSAIIGHSLGEFAAACISGIITVKEAVQLVLAQSTLQDKCAEDGGMAALGMSEEKARALLESLQLSHKLDIAAVNDADSVTVAGESQSIEILGQHLAVYARDIFWRILGTKRAFHTIYMEPIKEPFFTAVKRINLKPQLSKIPMYSTVKGEVLSDQQFNATKSVVIIIFLGLLGAGIYGVTHVDEAFKRRILAKDDSYLKQFLTTQEKQFELSVAVSIVETGVIDYEKYCTHENIRALTNIVTENKYYRDRLLSWMDTFSLYAEQTNESITGPNFLPALREFLRIPAYSHFSQDLKFTEDGSKLQASRIFGFMKITSGSTTQKNAMLTLYEDITEKRNWMPFQLIDSSYTLSGRPLPPGKPLADPVFSYEYSVVSTSHRGTTTDYTFGRNFVVKDSVPSLAWSFLHLPHHRSFEYSSKCSSASLCLVFSMACVSCLFICPCCAGHQLLKSDLAHLRTVPRNKETNAAEWMQSALLNLEWMNVTGKQTSKRRA